MQVNSSHITTPPFAEPDSRQKVKSCDDQVKIFSGFIFSSDICWIVNICSVLATINLKNGLED